MDQIDIKHKSFFRDRVLSCSKCGVSMFHVSMQKKDLQQRKNNEIDFIRMHRHCHGMSCQNCNEKFKNVQDFNGHLNSCNYNLAETKPSRKSPKVDFDHEKLLKWLAKRQSLKNFNREIGLTQDICLQCGLKNCTNNCRGVECAHCGHFFNVYLYRKKFNYL